VPAGRGSPRDDTMGGGPIDDTTGGGPIDDTTGGGPIDDTTGTGDAAAGFLLGLNLSLVRSRRGGKGAIPGPLSLPGRATGTTVPRNDIVESSRAASQLPGQNATYVSVKSEANTEL